MQFNTYTLAQIKFDPGLKSTFLTLPGHSYSPWPNSAFTNCLLSIRVHEALSTTWLSQFFTCL